MMATGVAILAGIVQTLCMVKLFGSHEAINTEMREAVR